MAAGMWSFLTDREPIPPGFVWILDGILGQLWIYVVAASCDPTRSGIGTFYGRQ